MTPERYRQIGDLYHAALKIESSKRSAFLEEACAGDASLRREVESLITSSDKASDFMRVNAFAVAAKRLAKEQDADLIGQTIAHYRIASLIGAGGMGRVYLADDTVLGRRVALKLLPEHFTHDRDQVQRFRQEARAASGLNHPNILTVHEVGQVNGIEFIATEYVEGETLREHISRGPFHLRDALDVAVQIADALIAAHQAGIIHRDIKPENIMIRRDHYVKVLDFGLAKLTEHVTTLRPSQLDAPTKAAIKTTPGMVMGTAEYMSPEQARGLTVDARTDVWSLGVVIYEMVMGNRPFSGPTPSDTVAWILERDPKRLMGDPSQTSAELERIVMKALTKNTDERYQTIKDMSIDLRRLRRKLEVSAEIERSGHADFAGKAIRVNSDATDAVETDVQDARGSATGLARTTSSLEYAVSEITRHKGLALIVGIVLVVFLGGVIFGVYYFLRPRTPTLLPFQATNVTRLTATGKAWDAAISPDGKYLVYVDSSTGTQDLWVKQVATGSTVRIVPGGETGYWGVTFSNDGNYVYYVIVDPKISTGVLYQIPSLGGVPKKLIQHVDSTVAFSPDGKRLAFIRDFLKKQETALVVANIDGSDEQTLAIRRAPNFFWSDAAVRISWSPDGKTIACPARNQATDGDLAGQYYYDVVGVSVQDGSEKVLTSHKWLGRVQQVSWLGDGKGLLVIAAKENSPMQVYYLSYPNGEIRRITNDLNNYSDVTLTADSTALATVQRNRISNIWVGPKEDVSQAKQITSGTLDGYGGIAWTPDGRIVYRSDASGKPDIWIMDADGNNRRQLTYEGESNAGPTLSSDGKYIVFASSRAGKLNVWRMDLDGKNQKQLTHGKTNSNPDFSPDGRWVVYASWDHGNATLWKVSIDGGTPLQVSGPTANLPIVSPDSKQIACYYWDEQANPTRGVMILAADGGEPTRRFNIRSGRDGFALRWMADGRSILFPRNMSDIWAQPVDGGNPVQLTHFQGDQLFNFDYSPDGKWIAVARGRVTEDAVLIRDLR
ncbi:MAG TPA: protein kinase [Pyrinomonadaceae bacterium]